jgi:hypothetical protein
VVQVAALGDPLGLPKASSCTWLSDSYRQGHHHH